MRQQAHSNQGLRGFAASAANSVLFAKGKIA